MNLDLICKDSGSSSLHFGLMAKANPDFLGSGVLSLLLRESRAGQGRPFMWGSILEPAQRGPELGERWGNALGALWDGGAWCETESALPGLTASCSLTVLCSPVLCIVPPHSFIHLLIYSCLQQIVIEHPLRIRHCAVSRDYSRA